MGHKAGADGTLGRRSTILLVLLLALTVVTAGCLSFLGIGGDGAAADGDGSGDGYADADDGGGGAHGDGTSDGEDGGGAGGAGSYDAYGYREGATYSFTYAAADEVDGALTLTVDRVDSGEVTVRVDLTTDGQSTSETVTAPADAVADELGALSPLRTVLVGTLYNPLVTTVANEDLGVGNQWIVQDEEGTVTVKVVGTRTIATRTCSDVTVDLDGADALRVCVSPDLALPLEVMAYDPATGAATFTMTLTTYNVP